MVQLELCKSNSIGDYFYAPTIVETLEVATEGEALRILATPMLNGFYWRRA